MYLYIYAYTILFHRLPHLVLQLTPICPYRPTSGTSGGLHVKLSGERLDVVLDEHTHLAKGFRTRCIECILW